MLSFESTPFAEALALGKVAQSRFRNQFGIHWIRNKTLITLMIANATNGTLTCQVNAFGVEGIPVGLLLQFGSHVQVVVVGKLKLKSRNTDKYIYIYVVIYIFSIITQVITDKLRYSVVERKTTGQNAKVITLKDGSKKYNATLMFIGKLSKVSHAT